MSAEVVGKRQVGGVCEGVVLEIKSKKEVIMNLDKSQEYEFLMKNRPHVVLLGAGVTMTAIPNGDKNGRKSSVMNNFIEELGMSSIIKNINLNTKSNNLEDIYSELYERTDCQVVRELLDNKNKRIFFLFRNP